MDYFLIDNGSLRPSSVLLLRTIASQLTQSTGHKIRPVGLMHSHKIDSEDLGGKPANSMEDLLTSGELEDVEEIRVLPFFLGPSLAITDWLPKNLQLWQQQRPSYRKFRILSPLHQSGDNRLARALHELCEITIKKLGFVRPKVAMVDHGTPLPEVNFVREQVGNELQGLLSEKISGFSTCSMERRPDPKYDFNNPLLENLLSKWSGKKGEQVLVSQFFLLPGRHAGVDGDLAEICKPFKHLGIRVERTDNLGSHPLVHEILADRVQAELATKTV